MLPFVAGATEPLTLNLPETETTLHPGKNAVRVEITGKNVFPYTLTWSYQTHQPASAANCPVKLSAKLDRTTVRESETVRLNVHIENASGGIQPYVTPLPLEDQAWRTNGFPRHSKVRGDSPAVKREELRLSTLFSSYFFGGFAGTILNWISHFSFVLSPPTYALIVSTSSGTRPMGTT